MTDFSEFLKAGGGGGGGREGRSNLKYLQDIP